jgi:hypothetical protein
MCFVLALCFTATCTPYEVAMLSTLNNARFVVNCVVDMVYLADMIRCSFLAYFHRKTGELVVSNSAIFCRYARSWFVLDLITIIPFDAITLLSQNKALSRAKAVKALRLIRLLKLLKMMKSSSIFSHYQAKLMGFVSYAQLNLFGNFFKILIICHWFACGWIMAATYECDEECMKTIYVNNKDALSADAMVYAASDDTWLVEELKRNILQKRTYISHSDRYKAGLYWAATTLTSVGYGDIHAFNSTEQALGFVLLLVSGLVWASIIADICEIAATLDINKIEFRRTVDQINYMMSEWTIPAAVQEKVRTFFFQSAALQRTVRYTRLMEQISPTLRADLLAEVPWWVRLSSNVYLFKSAGTAFLGEIVGKLHPSVFVAGEAVGRPETLLLLSYGVVLRHGKVKHQDAYWGDDLILHNPALREAHNAISFTYVELRTLTRKDLIKVLARFPVEHRFVRRYTARFALVRGILLILRAKKQCDQLESVPDTQRRDSEHFGEHQRWMESLSTGRFVVC